MLGSIFNRRCKILLIKRTLDFPFYSTLSCFWSQFHYLHQYHLTNRCSTPKPRLNFPFHITTESKPPLHFINYACKAFHKFKPFFVIYRVALV